MFTLSLKFGSFTLSFGRPRQRIVLKCVLHVQHVQHDYFSSFNQSDHCFLASPLLLSLLKLTLFSRVRAKVQKCKRGKQLQLNKGKITNEFLVSKETVVLRRWERSKQEFGFIKRVDKG